MAKKLMSLRMVEYDELNEVCQILDQNNIDFFQTTEGNWGISLPALWIKNDQQFDEALQLFNDYQTQRQVKIKQEYQNKNLSGENLTIIGRFKQEPIKFVMYLLIMAFFIYILVLPIIKLSG